MGPIRRVFEAQRHRLSRLTLLLGVVVVGLVLLPHIPRTVDVEFELGPSHREIVEVRVAYVKDGEELHGVSFTFPDGAPGAVRHSVSLPPGEFEVHTELRPSHGQSRGSVEKLHAPADGPVRIRLEPDAP
jgi:hypothetical protein